MRTVAKDRRGDPGLRYVETSGLLAALLEGDAAARRSLRVPGTTVSSALTFAEARRAVVRARHAGRLTVAQERAALAAVNRFRRRCAVMPMTEDVLARAGKPFPVEPVRTLDAIHLATAGVLADEPQWLTVLTRDERIRANAALLGYSVE
jgi:predicted nucleic acid-binding protein